MYKTVIEYLLLQLFIYVRGGGGILFWGGAFRRVYGKYSNPNTPDMHAHWSKYMHACTCKHTHIHAHVHEQGPILGLWVYFGSKHCTQNDWVFWRGVKTWHTKWLFCLMKGVETWHTKWLFCLRKGVETWHTKWLFCLRKGFETWHTKWLFCLRKGVETWHTKWLFCSRKGVWNRPWWMRWSVTVWTLSSCCWRTGSACTPFSLLTAWRSSTTLWVTHRLSVCKLVQGVFRVAWQLGATDA